MKKNYSVNDNYLKVNFMIKKENWEKIQIQRFKQKKSIKAFMEEILEKNL